LSGFFYCPKPLLFEPLLFKPSLLRQTLLAFEPGLLSSPACVPRRRGALHVRSVLDSIMGERKESSLG
jgi:hypothetical protein